MELGCLWELMLQWLLFCFRWSSYPCPPFSTRALRLSIPVIRQSRLSRRTGYGSKGIQQETMWVWIGGRASLNSFCLMQHVKAGSKLCTDRPERPCLQSYKLQNHTAGYLRALWLLGPSSNKHGTNQMKRFFKYFYFIWMYIISKGYIEYWLISSNLQVARIREAYVHQPRRCHMKDNPASAGSSQSKICHFGIPFESFLFVVLDCYQNFLSLVHKYSGLTRFHFLFHSSWKTGYNDSRSCTFVLK